MLPLIGIIIPHCMGEETDEPRVTLWVNCTASIYQSDFRVQTIFTTHADCLLIKAGLNWIIQQPVTVLLIVIEGLFER